jgi:hypothetical protein
MEKGPGSRSRQLASTAISSSLGGHKLVRVLAVGQQVMKMGPAGYWCGVFRCLSPFSRFSAKLDPWHSHPVKSQLTHVLHTKRTSMVT